MIFFEGWKPFVISNNLWKQCEYTLWTVNDVTNWLYYWLGVQVASQKGQNFSIKLVYYILLTNSILPVWPDHHVKYQFETTLTAVLDRRPKFYGCSRRFKTYGYGYGGRSLRPFLRPKVLFVVFLVFFQNGGWNASFLVFSLHRCHLSLD